MANQITVEEIVKRAVSSIEQHKHTLEVYGISNISDKATAVSISNLLRSKGYSCKILDNVHSQEYAIMIMNNGFDKEKAPN